MAWNKKRLGDFIEESTVRNTDSKLGRNKVVGLSTQKKIIDTKADLTGVKLSSYKLLFPGQFAYVPDTSRRGDKVSLAYNTTKTTYLVSSITTVFNVVKTSVLLPDYLYMFFNRPEFDRYARFNSWGSARESFSWEDMCDTVISLPPVEIQQKYVNIYRGIQNNYTVLSRKTEQLQRACICCMKSLIKSVPKRAIGEFLEQTNITNENLDYGIDDVRGISTSKEFIPTKANLTGVSLNNYKIVNPGKFAYVPDTSRRGNKISLTYNNTPQSFLVSSITNVFEVKNEKKKELLPDYLFLFLRRPEFDRYARYNSWGSAREVISWEDLGRLEIPVPSIDVQQSLVNLFKAFSKTRALSERLDKILKVICPILVRGAISEVQH